MTTTKKSSPVKTSTVVPGDQRPLLRKVYLYVVNNWAVSAGEINFPGVPQVTPLLKKLERAGLVASTHVNGEKELTWQSMYDIDNSDTKQTLRSARADFAKAFPKPVVAGTSDRSGATGPRYTDEQIKKGLAARKAGKTNVEVAKAAGVKSPSYFSKTLKAIEAASSKPAAKKPAAKKATKVTTKARQPRKGSAGPKALQELLKLG